MGYKFWILLIPVIIIGWYGGKLLWEVFHFVGVKGIYAKKLEKTVKKLRKQK